MSAVEPSGRTYSAPAVERAVGVIELLAASEQPLTVSEIGRSLDIPKSSVFAILHILRARGYVEKQQQERYSLTLKLFALGASMAAKLDLRQRLAPALRELASQTNLTAHLAVLAADEAVYIEKAESPGAIRLTTYVGCRAPLHSTGMGKALLAWLPESEVDRIVASRGLTAFTPRTVRSVAALKAELKKARAKGYAAGVEENEPGVCGVAAPVFDHTGHVAAAVNVGGTVLQIRKKDIPGLGERVARAAAAMSQRLGHDGSRPLSG